MKSICFTAWVVVLQATATPTPSRAAEASVTVHLLDHTHTKVTGAKFWIDWSKEWRAIMATKTAKGDEAEMLVKLLRASLLNRVSSHFCGHDPIYGVNATTADGKRLKTSLCFKCLTWVRPGERLDIAGLPGIENELCLALRKVIELPKEVIDQAAKKK